MKNEFACFYVYCIFEVGYNTRHIMLLKLKTTVDVHDLLLGTIRVLTLHLLTLAVLYKLLAVLTRHCPCIRFCQTCIKRVDTYCVPVFTEINNWFSHRQLHVLLFKLEKSNYLYIFVPEKKTFKMVYYIEQFSKHI